MASRATAIQWNMGFNRNGITPVTIARMVGALKELVSQHNPSIIALQEAPNPTDLQGKLANYYQMRFGPGKLITIYDEREWQAINDYDFYNHAKTISLNQQPHGVQIQLWNIHLPILNKSADERGVWFRRTLRKKIDEIRLKEKMRLELFLGDLNADPFEKLVIQQDSFWANRSLVWARNEKKRAVLPDKPLYNPSWGLLSRCTPPLGSYYLKKKDICDGPWYLVDQALMSPELAIDDFQHIELIDKAGMNSLCTSKTIKNPNADHYSDHLPLKIIFQVG